MGNEEARKGKKGEKQSIKRTHENGLSFEANDDRADLLSNEQHLKARLSSILSYKIGLKRLQKRRIKKGINHIVYCSITRAVIAKKSFVIVGLEINAAKFIIRKINQYLECTAIYKSKSLVIFFALKVLFSPLLPRTKNCIFHGQFLH